MCDNVCSISMISDKSLYDMCVWYLHSISYLMIFYGGWIRSGVLLLVLQELIRLSLLVASRYWLSAGIAESGYVYTGWIFGLKYSCGEIPCKRFSEYPPRLTSSTLRGSIFWDADRLCNPISIWWITGFVSIYLKSRADIFDPSFGAGRAGLRAQTLKIHEDTTNHRAAKWRSANLW